jgi:hypothetical protein
LRLDFTAREEVTWTGWRGVGPDGEGGGEAPPFWKAMEPSVWTVDWTASEASGRLDRLQIAQTASSLDLPSTVVSKEE